MRYAILFVAIYPQIPARFRLNPRGRMLGCVWWFHGPQARAALLGYVRRSLQLTAPYCVARGLGDPSAAFAAAYSADVPPGLAGGLTSGAQRAAGRAETK
jgi:hypothetical protein